MRVKIKPKYHDVGPLKFGTTYYMAFGGVTFGVEFTFTRANMIELREIKHNKKVAAYWTSKRELKHMLDSGAINWISELSETNIHIQP